VRSYDDGERVAFTGEAGKLGAHLYRPSHPDGRRPAVVLNHGSSLETDSKPGVSRILTDAGYVVLVPFRRGYTGSEGPSRVDQVTADPGTPAHGAQVCQRLAEESSDVLSALAFVRELPDVDPDRVAVMGSSYGGINSILAAARDTGLRACVSFAAAAMSWGPVPEIRDFLIGRLGSIRCPLLLLQASNDFDTTPSERMAQRCEELGVNCVRHMFGPYGANEMEAHLLWTSGTSVWTPVVLPFLAENL
jgi:carboxymethylenebutenolidase